ncbi:MAG: hypothetical protein US40_C0011G0013 [Candidatus Roizmanbacteria bacterium GW2011_GWC2_37_13]|uniref:EamA domain-containing protein n=1 Tax=Candidatus Roizmanbacteria bacterium GW2011_GWC2_37_13 TaxID=1618486 RepID=A0A0G0G1U6_9BACT|nr:MAG: hypothetical protein US38_C0007G0013 [Candidatus Roizmanbacteria bacterium GW2011_GWC1_37_12]KKQ25128.1 MAG: hypothetical protein US40_C0011G0013 [Candidatus Roizmanbacteria bacterium GW2011_GWC2_37_13]
MSIVMDMIAAIMALIIFFVSGGYKKFSLPTGFQPWFYLMVAMLFYGLFDRLRFYATAALEASRMTVVNNVSLIVAVVLSFFLYAESLTTNKLFGFILVLFALFLVSIDKVSKINWKGVFLAIIVNIFLGIAWALDKKGALFFNVETYNVLAWILPMVFVYFPYIKFSDIKKEVNLSFWKITLLAFFNMIALFLNLKALSLADATRVIPIVQTSTLFTVIFGIILLKERKHLIRKLIAGLIAVFGVYLLV